jgi:hypothetical protein
VSRARVPNRSQLAVDLAFAERAESTPRLPSKRQRRCRQGRLMAARRRSCLRRRLRELPGALPAAVLRACGAGSSGLSGTSTKPATTLRSDAAGDSGAGAAAEKSSRAAGSTLTAAGAGRRPGCSALGSGWQALRRGE